MHAKQLFWLIIISFFLVIISTNAQTIQQTQKQTLTILTINLPKNIELQKVSQSSDSVTLSFNHAIPAPTAKMIAPVTNITSKDNNWIIQHFSTTRFLTAVQKDETLTLTFDRGVDSAATKIPAHDSFTKPALTIVIDAGHGGYDPGAINPDGVQEKNITLSIALKLKDILQTTANSFDPPFTIILTRSDDEFISLSDRLRLAIQNNAVIFISIHADSFSDPAASGIGLYTRSNVPSDLATAKLAARENAADPSALPDDLLAFLDSKASETQRNQSVILADALKNSLINNSLALQSPPLRQAGFMVLRQPFAASVLVETGFLTNPEQVTHLTSTLGQNKIAASLAAGIIDYLRQNQGK